MRSTLLVCAALVVLGSANSSADAFCCPPPAYWAYQPCVVTCYRTEWKEEKVPVTLQRLSYRPETTKVKVTTFVPTLVDQKIQTSYFVSVPKLVEWDATSCVMVPFVIVDPCTGCCYTSCYPQWVKRKVQSTVIDRKLQTREDIVKVCKLVPQEKLVDQVRMVPVVTQEQSWTVRRSCVVVPYQKTVYVPVLVPGCP